MREILTDIREKLQHGEYQNEEHIRLSLVCRLLSNLGWNIWNPREVNTEFPAIPAEDKTKVDIALFAKESSPSIFVEVKAVGKIAPSLSEVERQVRDYNRNNTALFSVITDGRSWRLYYSQTGGEFHEKCFKECDLLDDDLDDLEQTFSLFFSKENIVSGRAEDQAGKYLQLTNKQKAVQDSLPQARRLVQAPPYPSLLQAIVGLVKNKDFVLSETEAAELLGRMSESSTSAPILQQSPAPSAEWVTMLPSKSQVSKKGIPSLNPDNPGDLSHTKVEGTIGGKYGRKWNKLVCIGIRLALQSGDNVRTLNALLPANIKEGIYTEKGYSPMEDLNLSVQGISSNNSAKTLLLLAKKLNCQLELIVSWQEAGKQGVIRWPS
ncbi:MAG: type I restriction enzyme HsdR N-terminal domain-containing protein [Proteobacteria bacterium]|nr:type I restriction enzyme HsdR N-terminal domain-containing protein [Pseudomonadota bacterium]